MQHVVIFLQFYDPLLLPNKHSLDISNNPLIFLPTELYHPINPYFLHTNPLNFPPYPIGFTINILNIFPNIIQYNQILM